MFEGSSSTELNKAVEALRVLFVAIVTHNIGVFNFSEILHDYDFPLIAGIFLKHFFIHKLNSNDSVFAEMVTFIYDSEIALS